MPLDRSGVVTAAGNVPRNNALRRLAATMGRASARQAFEGRWHAFHAVRTVLAVAAFVLMSVSTLCPLSARSARAGTGHRPCYALGSALRRTRTYLSFGLMVRP